MWHLEHFLVVEAQNACSLFTMLINQFCIKVDMKCCSWPRLRPKEGKERKWLFSRKPSDLLLTEGAACQEDTLGPHCDQLNTTLKGFSAFSTKFLARKVFRSLHKAQDRLCFKQGLHAGFIAESPSPAGNVVVGTFGIPRRTSRRHPCGTYNRFSTRPAT